MKHFTFLTNGSSRKSVQVMTRTKPGNDHDLSRTCVRLDSHLSRLCLASLICLCMLTVGSGNAWGANVGPTTISISSGWTNKSGATYCGGYGKNTGWYVSDYNITALSTVLSNAGNSNFSLTIRVKGLVNQGGSGGYVNSLSVVLLNSSGSTVGDPQTITNLPNGTSSSAAQWKSFSFTPTSAVTGYKIYGGKNCAVFQTEYTLTYDNAPSCDKTVTLNYDGDASGLHGSFVLKAGSSSGATIAEGGTTENCGSGTTSVVVVPTPDEHYHVASVSATNKTGTISGPDGDGNYTISYTQGSNISSTVTVGFEEDTKYTVTWMSNGSQHTTTQVYSGEKPTFPTNPSSCDGTSTAFYGWATATWTGKLNDVSSKTIYLSGDAMPAVSGAVTYYAVFAKESATAFEKITSADNIYVGQKIAIVSDKQDYILPSNFAATTAATHPNSNDSKLTVTSSQVWTITDIDEYGYYKLKNSTTQMGVNRTSGLTSGSAAVGNYSTVASWWAINETTDFDYTVDDCFYIYNWATNSYYNFLENSGSSWLSYYAADITSGNKVWYAMKLYQPERSEFLTTCCTALGSINGSVNLTYP